MGSMISGLLGGKEAAPPVMITPAPQPAKTEEIDPEAKRLANERLAQAKLRKGRAALRTDLVTGGSGAGIAIPT